MPTALTTINIAKEQAATYQPLLLAKFAFADGAILRLSTHPLNVAEGGAQYGGVDWLGRISEQSIQQVQALSETGVDLIPNVTLALADPDGYLYSNWETPAARGFKGAELILQLVFYDPIGGAFSSDSRIPFIGICEHPASDAAKLTVSAVAKTGLMRALLPVVPIQQRCPWTNPTTTAQRATADNEDSPYYECGETRDLATAPPCEYTTATCTRLNRRGNITYTAPAGMRVREYTSGNWADVKGTTNEAAYGDRIPMLYGTAWLEPPILSAIPDGNYLRGECIVCLGAAEVLKVAVNGIQLSAANQPDGTPYSAANRDFRFHFINAGNRDGAPNADVPWSGGGDPYGSMTAIMFVLPRLSGGGEGIPRVRVLARSKSLRKYAALTQIVVASNVATATLVGPNIDIASNDPAWPFEIFDTNGTTINAEWTGLTNWTNGPPGTFTFTTAGVADGTYTGGFVRYKAATENVAWIIADLLTWTNYKYADLDIASFCEVAAVIEARPCATVLRQRRSAAEIIRALRQAHGLLLVPEHGSGKLRLSVKRTLADQQPATISGSNYDTPIASVTAAGGATNGYAAYRFDAAAILRTDLPISLKELTRAGADAPNRIQLAFQDRERDHAVSTVSVIDSDDTARMAGQEISGNLSVQPEGLTSYADAMRAARVSLAEIHRGNTDGDTRGTRVFEWETSFRALHLRVGQIVLLHDALKGLTNQPVRITKIQPAQNYETVKLTGHWHDDEWYTDAYAASAVLANRREEQARRGTPFVWAPNAVAGVTGDAWYPAGRNTFSAYQQYVEQADGSQTCKLRIAGALPQNRILSALTPPVVPLQASTSPTGGQLVGSRSYFFALAPKDAGGAIGPLSPVIRADITDAGAANSITLAGLAWDAATAGWVLYGGTSHLSLCAQQEASGTPSSITFTGALQRASFGPPDPAFDSLRLAITRVRVAGAYTGAVSVRTSNSLTFPGVSWATNQWAGRVVSILAAVDGGYAPLCHLAIASNTGDTLTVSGSPLTAGVAVGDWATIRLAVSEGGATLTDTLLALAVNAEIGKIARVIEGAGAGQERRIVSNTATAITMESAFSAALAADSIVVVEEPLPDLTLDSASQQATAPGVIDLDAALPNYDGQTVAVRVGTVSASGEAVPEWMWPRREVYVAGGSAVITGSITY